MLGAAAIGKRRPRPLLIAASEGRTYPVAVLDDFRTVAERQLDPFFGRNAPDVLYHYTGSVGLIGILGQEALWCTQVQYLNDSQELYHAAALVAKCAGDTNSDFEVFERVRD